MADFVTRDVGRLELGPTGSLEETLLGLVKVDYVPDSVEILRWEKVR